MALVADVTVTFAFGTAAPDGSVTVPKMLPKTAWPEAGGVQRLMASVNTAKVVRATEAFAFMSASHVIALALQFCLRQAGGLTVSAAEGR